MKINSEFYLFCLIICFYISSAYAQIRRCANPNPSYTVAENISLKKTTVTTISVPVIFHVIYDNSGNGNVSEIQLQKQIDTLNATHSRAGSQFRFFLYAITRTNNIDWWDINFKSRPDPPTYKIPSQTEVNMTNPLAIDPTHAFNVYTSRLINYYGWVIYYPWEISEDSKQNGVIIDYRTLPGGEYSGYNYGYTLVHEGGHYLGLYHTFQNSCTPPGDAIDDTPYQDSGDNIFVCDDALDTCPNSPGKDPVHNYMNYTDDVCYNQFTAGQMERVSTIMAQYRPNLGGTTLVLASTYTVANNSSLKIFPGMTLSFTNGSSLTLNSMLTANGSSSSTPITFNFISPNSSTQNGIVFNSGSNGTINYCQIRNAYRGIYENNATVNITNSAISGCTNGIYLYSSSPTIQGCNIHDNTSYGINMLYSSPTIKGNYIQSNSTGVYCQSSSTPVIGDNSSQVGNNITNNNYGVIVYNNALPAIGNGSSGGYNNLTNPNTNILNATGNTVYAQHNWWGTTDPNNFKITGSVSYSPYLTAAVSVPSPSLNKASVNLASSVNNDDIPMLSELDKAYQLVASNNLAEARNVCLNLVNNYPNYSVSYNALNLLKETYTGNELTAKKDIYKSLFNNKGKKELYAMAGLILSDIDKGNKLKQIDDVIAAYKGDSVIELALFDKFVYYYFELNDKGNARTISNELDEQFPLSEGAVEAHKILGDEKYFKIEPARKPNQNPVDKAIAGNSLSNYPNPFNPSTSIFFTLKQKDYVTLIVYDILGKEVARLIDGIQTEGEHSVSFDRNSLASGMYIYRLKGTDFEISKKMLMIK